MNVQNTSLYIRLLSSTRNDSDIENSKNHEKGDITHHHIA